MNRAFLLHQVCIHNRAWLISLWSQTVERKCFPGVVPSPPLTCLRNKAKGQKVITVHDIKSYAHSVENTIDKPTQEKWAYNFPFSLQLLLYLFTLTIMTLCKFAWVKMGIKEDISKTSPGKSVFSLDFFGRVADVRWRKTMGSCKPKGCWLELSSSSPIAAQRSQAFHVQIHMPAVPNTLSPKSY